MYGSGPNSPTSGTGNPPDVPGEEACLYKPVPVLYTINMSRLMEYTVLPPLEYNLSIAKIQDIE